MRFMEKLFIASLLLPFAASGDLPIYSTCSSKGITTASARGRIRSPNYPGSYPANSDCKWTLVSAKGHGIRLYVEYLDNKEVFANGDGDCYDKLRISKGRAGGTYTEIDDGGLCASNADELRKRTIDIPNSGNDSVQVQITFTSDYEEHKTGFSIYFEALCNETQEGLSGIIRSPSHPDKYPDNAACFTVIKASAGNQIEIEFTKFRLEDQSRCSTDYVTISEGYPGDAGAGSRVYCRPSIVGTLIKVDSKIATVKFASDDTLAYSGFEAKWKAVVPTTMTPTTSAVATPEVEAKTPVTKNCSYTETGRTCQRWDVNTPHEPKHWPEVRNHNFCRIPDNDSRPWCYTTDPDKRFEYCDLDNCVARETTTGEETTTSELTTQSETTTQESDFSTTEVTSDTKTLIAVFESVSPQKQTSDDKGDGVSWYIYLIIGIVILLILLLVIIFFVRRRRRKGAARIEHVVEDTVHFSQLNQDDGRPRENTYVEIPFTGRVLRGNGANENEEVGYPQKSGKNGFVPLDRASRNASSSSHDSIASAKERARRGFVSVNPNTSSFMGAYSAADDVTPNDGAGTSTNPYQMAEDLGKSNAEENLYSTIEMEQANGQDAKPVSTPLPPTPVPRVPSKNKMSKKKESKKEAKKISGKKKKSSSTSQIGFGNPSYREQQAKDKRCATENPFDTDEDVQKSHGISRDYDWNSPIDVNDKTQAQNVGQWQNNRKDEEMIPTRSGGDQAGTDSPYMAPKLPRPNKETMVTISPDIIDNKEPVLEIKSPEESSLYSTPKPTSPIFEMSDKFLYDLPRHPRPATSSFDSANSQTSSSSDGPPKTGDSIGNSSKISRDSGNSSLLESVGGDENQTEYCTMNSVPRGSTTSWSSVGSVPRIKEGKQEDKSVADNRLSRLYMSMKEGDADNKKEARENLTHPRTSF